MKILKMLEEGKISSQEAVKLLETIGADSNSTHTKARTTTGADGKTEAKTERAAEPKWVEGIRNVTMDIGQTIRDAIGDEDVFNFEFDWFTSTEKVHQHLSESLKNTGAHTLVIEGINAPISLVTHNENGYDTSMITLEISAGARASGKHKDRSRNFELAVQNGVMRLQYDEKAFKNVGVKVSVPKTVDLRAVVLKTRNGAIAVNELAASEIETITKNGSIKINGCTGQRLTCDTKNGGIFLNNIEMADINALTKNAKIVLNSISGRECECFISAETKNASISTKLLNEGRALKINASTTNSRVTADVENLEYLVNMKNHVEAATAGYEYADYKLDLKLKSANGKILVR